MLRSAIKLIVFFFITASCIFILKKSGTKDNANVRITLPKAMDTSFFFIGSSRVQKGIDPLIITNGYDNVKVFNWGITSGTFLNNCIVADFAIKQPGQKVVFIELAPLVDVLPDGLFNFATHTRLDLFGSVLTLTANQSFSEQSMLMLKIINDYFYKCITVRNEVKHIIGHTAGVKVNDDYEKWIGFSPSNRNGHYTTRSFLTSQEINNCRLNSINLVKYQVMISYLEGLAKSNNSRVVFFLPITSMKQAEKNIVIPLYHTLPDSMKLEYSSQFLQQMADAEYLLDINHLNRKGATTYSTLLIPLLEKYR
ncbi:hypothetical protein [Chryseosolibacter indicus]|uniref:SGNH/GDSL hydrolase family protein n=1 Tax=Chryseosolibacter indicus TaxID=2782351 RepID=A0ABS5VZD1_9BACT|nr:hypothetical protein [Chryseosolibacter indicus]MBT1705391.1 hypothetical protein [Chryseosolibacter indicus]